MKKITSLLSLLIIVSGTLLFMSCGDDDGPGSQACNADWAAAVSDELNAVTAAATAYASDQSTANCDALKAAYQIYIDAAVPFGDCSLLTGADRDAWQQALNEAQANVDNIC